MDNIKQYMLSTEAFFLDQHGPETAWQLRFTQYSAPDHLARLRNVISSKGKKWKR